MTKKKVPIAGDQAAYERAGGPIVTDIAKLPSLPTLSISLPALPFIPPNIPSLPAIKFDHFPTGLPDYTISIATQEPECVRCFCKKGDWEFKARLCPRCYVAALDQVTESFEENEAP